MAVSIPRLGSSVSVLLQSESCVWILLAIVFLCFSKGRCTRTECRLLEWMERHSALTFTYQVWCYQLAHVASYSHIVLNIGTRVRKTSACFIQWRDTDVGRCSSSINYHIMGYNGFPCRGWLGSQLYDWNRCHEISWRMLSKKYTSLIAPPHPYPHTAPHIDPHLWETETCTVNPFPVPANSRATHKQWNSTGRGHLTIKVT